MLESTTFAIFTEPLGPGKGAWVRVRIYNSVEDLREAARRLHPWTSRAEWSNCYGCFQPVPYRERFNPRTGKFVVVRPPNHFRGTMRLFRPFTYEVVAHEITHAALTIYRMDVRANANFGMGCSETEEKFAYILGQLSDQFMKWLIEASNE